MPGGETCDKRLCKLCAVRVGNEDHCPSHTSTTPTERTKPVTTSTQTSLFAEDPCQGNHGDNPESRAAFEGLLPHLSRLQEKVLEYVCGRTSGATVKGARRDLALEHQTASARLTELQAAGLVEDTGKRRDRCRVMAATDLGRRTLAAWRRGHSAAA